MCMFVHIHIHIHTTPTSMQMCSSARAREDACARARAYPMRSPIVIDKLQTTVPNKKTHLFTRDGIDGND